MEFFLNNLNFYILRVNHKVAAVYLHFYYVDTKELKSVYTSRRSGFAGFRMVGIIYMRTVKISLPLPE